ncbi:MAG TPA: phosphotransferase [Phototrophicaceae bacterium]|nr:phosphotransferase [Phototrophicaceae bacterium]
MDDQQCLKLVHALDAQAYLLRTWPLTGGVSAQMTALELLRTGYQTQKVIVREPNEADLRRNPQAAAVQFRLLKALRAAGLATPDAYYLDESGEITPLPYLVMEYIDGQPQLAPPHVGGFVRQIAAYLAQIHRIETSKLDFLPLRPPAFTTLPNDDYHGGSADRLRVALAAVTPLERRNPSVLLHGDFWAGNILWKNNRLAAVVDWEDATLGDPLTDFAISRLDTLLIFGVQAMQDFTQQYQSALPIDYTDLPYWDLFAALRAAPYLGDWIGVYPALGRPDISEAALRASHQWFVEQAFAALAAK